MYSKVAPLCRYLMNMVCLTKMYVVVAFLFAILSSLCNKHNHTSTLSDVESQDSSRRQCMDSKMEQRT